MNIFLPYFLYAFIVLAVILMVGVLPHLSYQSRTKWLSEQGANRDRQLKKIYTKIPPSTMVTLTSTERKFYRLVGIAMLIVWCVGMVIISIPSLLTSYPFLIHDTKEIPVTIIETKYIKANDSGRARTVDFYEIILSAKGDGIVMQDDWTFVGGRYTPRQGDIVDGLMYRNGDHIELGIKAVIYPIFHWGQILVILILTLIAILVMTENWKMITPKTVRFEKLSLDYKEARYQQVLKK